MNIIGFGLLFNKNNSFDDDVINLLAERGILLKDVQLSSRISNRVSEIIKIQYINCFLEFVYYIEKVKLLRLFLAYKMSSV